MTTKKNYDIGTWLRQNLFLIVFILIFDKLRNLWYCNSGLRTNTLAYFGAAYMTEKIIYYIGTWLRQNLVFILILIGTMVLPKSSMCYYDKYMSSCHSATMVLP
jgi:hypothetical protein